MQLTYEVFFPVDLRSRWPPCNTRPVIMGFCLMKPQAGNNLWTASFPFTFHHYTSPFLSLFKMLQWWFLLMITRAPTPHLPSSSCSSSSLSLSEAGSAEGHRESLTTSEKRLILFAPTLTGPLILQVYLSSEHLALLTTWPALLHAAC